MEYFCIGVKIVYSISIEKLVWVWKGSDLQDINNIIMQFCTCFISCEYTYLTDTLSAEHCEHLYTRFTQKFIIASQWMVQGL